MADLTGKTLGRYRIMERIGRGGMAEVYKGYQASLDRYVAVKVLHPFLLEEEGSRDRFQREARAVAALRHPHIVQVFDYDAEGEVYFMVMEFIDGPNLKTVLHDHAKAATRMSLDRIGTIITGIGGALAYAHRQNMIHRDVKPHNIMFTADGHPLLTDFGIAKIIGGSNVSASGMMSGTPAYMSPEQGRAETLDLRTDIYSLGVVLYEMVTGRVPFDADTPFAVVIKHINDPLPMPRSLDATIPEGLERVILKAMAKNPDDRYATADEMVQATQEAIRQARAATPADLPVVVPPLISEISGGQSTDVLTGVGQGSAGTRPVMPVGTAAPLTVDLPVAHQAAAIVPAIVEPLTPIPPIEPTPPTQPTPPTPPTKGTQMTASMGAGRTSCTVAVSVVAALVVMIGGASLLNMNNSASQGGSPQPTIVARQATATVPIAAANQAATATPRSAAATAPPATMLAMVPPTPPSTAGEEPPSAEATEAIPAYPDASPDTVDEDPLSQGFQLFDERKYEEALAAFDQALADDATEGDAWLGRGLALQGLGRAAEAGEAFNKAMSAYEMDLNDDPRDGDALAGRGHTLLALKRYDEAVQAFTEALAVRGSDDAEVRAARAWAYLGLNQQDRAIQDAEVVLAQDADNKSMLLLRAQAYYEKFDVQKAIEEYTAILKTYSDDPEIYRGRAVAYMYADNPPAAIADFKKAIELAPNDASLWVGLGDAYMDYGENYKPNVEQSDLAYTNALLIDKQNADAYYRRANLRANWQGNGQGALDDVNKAIEIGPPTAEMYYLRAGLRLNLNNDNVGWQDDLDKAVAVDPKDPTPYHWRMEARFHLQQYAKAVEDADSILEIEPANWQVLFERSRLHLILGDQTKAKADAQQIIYGKPEWAGGYAALAHIYMANGDGTRAVEEATKAVDRKEGDNAAYVLALRGRSYIRAGDYGSAAADLKTAAAIKDDNWMVLFGQAEVEFVNDRPDDALPYIEKWERVNEGFGGAYVLRATIYANRNQYADARKDLERAQALALFPDEAGDAATLAEKLKP